eukprot:197045_1
MPVALVLSFCKTFIIPNVVDSFHASQKHRNKFIMFLRTVTLIIVPLLSSIFMLNECGNGWTMFWDSCQQSRNNMFNIETTVTTKFFRFGNNYDRVFGETSQKFSNLLTTSDVCGLQSSEIHVSKCLREIFDLWINILIKTTIIMLFNPIFIVFYKILQNKIVHKVGEIKVDSQYILCATKLEICLIFGFICPILLPLTICALKWNEMFYRYVSQIFN